MGARPQRFGAPWPCLALCAGLLACSALATGCEVGGGDDSAATEGPVPGKAKRTVDIELLRTAERVLSLSADGVASFPEPVLIGGVEACIVRRRAAFHSFEAFVPVDPPLCATSEVDRPIKLTGAPANSDLLITQSKAGYRTVLTTFRTDDHDVALPTWAENPDHFTPLLRAAATLPIEDAPSAHDDDGLMAIWSEAVGEYGSGQAEPQLNANADPGVVQAEGVRAQVETSDGSSVVTLTTRRDRPRFVSVKEGSYAVRFSDPIHELVPLGVQEQFMITGLPTADFSTVEAPVLRGQLTLVMVDGYCPLPVDPQQPFSDLSTCMLDDDADAGTP